MAANLYIRYQMLFQKILSKSDIDEGRVYIPARRAEIFRHLANRAEVTAYDVRMRHSWPMRFYRRDDQRAYLGHSWSDFAIANRLREGDKVTFYELRPQEEQGHGARLIFQIEGPRFDLNEPPSPEN